MESISVTAASPTHFFIVTTETGSGTQKGFSSPTHLSEHVIKLFLKDLGSKELYTIPIIPIRMEPKQH